ncbi:MAG TPA: hypothetical protein VGW78_00425 [Candidatus Babeliales bacterium]|nr:hypothetical protein [Candidatus Babeliales bacterium]
MKLSITMKATLFIIAGTSYLIGMESHSPNLPTELWAKDIAKQCDWQALISLSHTNQELHKETQPIIAQRKAILLATFPPLLKTFPRPSNLNDVDRFWHKATGTYFLKEKIRRFDCQRVVFACTDGNKVITVPIISTPKFEEELSRSNRTPLNSLNIFSTNPPCISFYGNPYQITEYSFNPYTHILTKKQLSDYMV